MITLSREIVIVKTEVSKVEVFRVLENLCGGRDLICKFNSLF